MALLFVLHLFHWLGNVFTIGEDMQLLHFGVGARGVGSSLVNLSSSSSFPLCLSLVDAFCLMDEKKGQLFHSLTL